MIYGLLFIYFCFEFETCALQRLYCEQNFISGCIACMLCNLFWHCFSGIGVKTPSSRMF